MLEVATALKEARRQAKQTLREAAEEIGCSYQSLSNWERKSSVPHPLWEKHIDAYLRKHSGSPA